MADINYPIANNDEFNQHKLDYIEQRQNRFQHEEMVANKQREDYQKKMEKHRQIEQKVHQDLNKNK